MQLGYVNPDVFDIQVGPCPIGQLENEYLRRIANGNAMFQAEFKSLPESTGNITKEASLNEINKDKNRYINIIAYDQTRVRLQEIDDEPGSDYINACYVDGYKHPAKFIASQGPREDTVNDFWRMVWEQNSTTIVMLTKCFEHGKEKCAQYWPDAGTGTYGPLTVTCEDNVTCCDYVIRKFSVAEVEDEEGIHARSVTQFHYLGWPDFGAPEYPYSVLSFLKRVRQMTYAKSDKGNIVIHCSAGVGRTGTYILIDTMIEMIANEKKVDIYNFIYKIRSQRNLLVQSIVQYIFIHRALVEEYKFGHTEVDLMNLTKYYLTLTKPDPETQKSGVDKEYRMVASQHVEDTKQEWGNKEANKEKNRLRQVVPYDRNRVKLERMIGEEHSDYINASFIHGYENRRAYVATQGPLPKTASDFWRMVWEEQSSTIVMLTKLSERGQESDSNNSQSHEEVCHRYWPDQGDSSTQSYLAIQHVNESDQGEYIVRDFQLTNTKGGGLRNIRQYHFQDWPEVGMPESGVSLIKLIGEAHKHQKNINQFPIIVHGSSGAGRTGVFCALSILLARIQAEGVVDVFQTVRTLRQQRPHMVQDPTQYQFCYKAVLNHLDSYGTYANYK
ncbi:receptor-type tyrosine-protein phosphatase alpha-like isoform X2 [Amphiura filiformis]|uniref:receptor-type tyrosine-protein phosphatase alpha-like isoform X2 n=1 Tax=Amphiura filiformis TaxID=82378 RepID=UPI003B2284F3